MLDYLKLSLSFGIACAGADSIINAPDSRALQDFVDIEWETRAIDGITVSPTATLRFNYDTGDHNVFRFLNENAFDNCLFGEDDAVFVGDEDPTLFDMSTLPDGTEVTWFGSNVDDSCSTVVQPAFRQRITVSIAQADEPDIAWQLGFDSNTILTKGENDVITGSRTDAAQHNVVQFSSVESFENCDFDGSDPLVNAAVGGDFSIDVSLQPGETVFYGCSVPGHCTGQGMKFTARAPLRIEGSEWTNENPSLEGMQIEPSGLLVIGQTTDNHNVFEFPSQEAFQSCNFGEATELNGATQNTETQIEFVGSAVGTVRWFGCSIGDGGHCRQGQKVAVTVVADIGQTDAPTPSPIDPEFTWGLNFDPLTIFEKNDGDVLVGELAGDATHSVFRFSSVEDFNSCNFDNAEEVFGRAETGVFNIPMTFSPGETEFYGCDVLTHCTGAGMKFTTRSPLIIDGSEWFPSRAILEPRQIEPSGRLVIGQTAGEHNVFEFPSREAFQSCNFTQATQLNEDTRNSETSIEFVDNAVGTVRWFGCSIRGGDHCRDGQKVAVTVVADIGQTDAPTPSPVDPEFTWGLGFDATTVFEKNAGDVLVGEIVSEGVNHNVVRLPSLEDFEACNFANAENVIGAAQGGTFSIDMTLAPGETEFYACSINQGGHCSGGGMKFTVASPLELEGSIWVPNGPIEARQIEASGVFVIGQTAGLHNVLEFPTKEAFDGCDFSGATVLNSDTQNSQTVINFEDTAVGTVRWFGCSVNNGRHCLVGQKVAVSVVADLVGEDGGGDNNNDNNDEEDGAIDFVTVTIIIVVAIVAVGVVLVFVKNRGNLTSVKDEVFGVSHETAVARGTVNSANAGLVSNNYGANPSVNVQNRPPVDSQGDWRPHSAMPSYQGQRGNSAQYGGVNNV